MLNDYSPCKIYWFQTANEAIVGTLLGDCLPRELTSLGRAGQAAGMQSIVIPEEPE